MHPKLRPFSIGSIRVDFPFVLGSMSGYTDLAYRTICRRMGAEFCATEMMLDKTLLSAPKLLRRLAALSESDHPVAAQLIGNDPETMSRAASLLCEIGFDVIDLNFACPVRKVLSRRRGGYLMKESDRALEITRAVIAAVDRPVTLKLRKSFYENDGDGSFERIAEGAFDVGLSAMTVHGRSVEAKYTGPADWDFLAEVKRRFPDRTVIASGDMLAPERGIEALERTCVDAIAVARGALGNPWFFRQVRDVLSGRAPYRPSLREQRDVLLEHYDRACELYGPRRGPKHMRKFGIKYARLHPRPRDVRAAFVAATDAGDWGEVVGRMYE